MTAAIWFVLAVLLAFMTLWPFPALDRFADRVYTVTVYALMAANIILSALAVGGVL